MKNNKKADTIAWIIIAVFILSFALLWIVNVLDYNKDIWYNYEKETDSYILKSNSENILKKLNTWDIEEDEKFYIYKDDVTKEYKIFTWASNEQYKYVDKDWNHVDPATNIGKTFVREYEKKIDILRYDIKPPEIDDLIFHFDANNIDDSYNSTLTWWQLIDEWVDLADQNWQQNAVDKSTISTPGYSTYSSSLPTYNESGINLLPMVEFNGTNQMLAMARHKDINNDGDCYAQEVFTEKSFAIVFKTWENITSQQMVYEQWWAATWYNFMIYDWDVWAWIHNKSNSSYACTDFSSTDSNYYYTRDSWHQFKSVNLWEVLPNTTYFVMVVQDSTHKDIDWNFIDSQNKLKIYLNWFLAAETDHVDPQPEHSYWALWNIFLWNVNPKTTNTISDVWWSNQKAYFEWWIWELISRNHALNENEIRWVQNYFSQKWLWGKKSIRYDIINSSITELKEY